MAQFDLVILLTKRNLNLLETALPFYRENIAPKHVYVIANNAIQHELKKLEVIFVDETSLYLGLNINHIADIIEEISGSRERAGWYLQQFLKLAWSYQCSDDSYIVIDADTIPLNKIDFINENGQYLLTKKIEYNKPYFDTIQFLFNGKIKKKENFSFIAENIIFDCECVKEMIRDIETNDNLKGDNFYEKILYAINPKDILASGFSEYETYGNYMLTYYPDKIQMRTLRTFREGVSILGKNPSYEQLIWAKKDFDIVSIEITKYRTTFFTWLAGRRFFRNHCKLGTFARFYLNSRTLCRNLLGVQDIRFE